MSSSSGQPPRQALLGGVPSTIPDIPVSAVLLALFVAGGATHLTIFVRNRRRGPEHHFFFSFLLFVFPVTRVAALSLRIAWARARDDADVALAATVFTAAGVLILFIVNLILARRVVRALHPRLGRHPALTHAFRALLATIVAILVMVVVCTVHSSLGADAAARAKERDVLLFAGVYVTVVALLPAVAVALAWALPNRGPHPPEPLGTGPMWAKVALLGFASLLLTLGAGFRVGVNFAAKPAGQEQWYHSKPAFYCFNFVLDLIVVYSYAIFRFDRMFHIPPVDHKSSASGHSSGNDKEAAHGSGPQQHPGLGLNAEKGSFGESGRDLMDKHRDSGPGHYEV
ncbi:uncharacterized protein P884DRAFT_323667 [Thermothelomyces heterothallicus CBS 202.75]|uniref:uncharacterized protein n=1 Tax=Thermothelomyces heterothallicus CBS 202.75 TaxID=1149848 RepID=UPI003744B1CE